MRADPTDQQRLLDLQAFDSRAGQLRHQRRSLPEVAELASLGASRHEIDDRRRDQQIVVDDLAIAQRKADQDVEVVRARRTRDRDRMDRGQVGAKDLERLQAELVSLERRITTLEDEELEVMEQLETAQAELDELGQRVAAADERLAELTVQRDEKSAVIDHELAGLDAGRGAAVEGLPADLLTLYERLREAKGGVGAAALVQRRCTGCQLGIDATVLQQLRSAPEDQVTRCEECSRILVRTAESGL